MVYKKEPAEDAFDYHTRIQQLFDEIESKCGLLKEENGGYLFWHLTFQEFNCASYLTDNSEDQIAAIDAFWNDSWYHEMIELYIGLLSVQNNKTIANKIVKTTFNKDAAPDYTRWLIAAKGLYDIHKDRRNDDTVAKAQEKLQIVMKNSASRKIKAEAGELLGWLGDTRDLKEFVKIEGGKYKLEDGIDFLSDNTTKKFGTTELAPFEISRYPVTNVWYGEFIKLDGYKYRAYWSDEGWQWLEKEKIEYPEYWHDRKWKCPNAPVVGVSFWEAEAFCRWLSVTDEKGRKYKLPNEKQWQAAAAGKQGRKYPWGPDWDFTRCNCGEGENDIEKTSAVGIFERGKTPEGIYDMAGNVWEWCDEIYEESGDARVVRGGSWLGDAGGCRCAYRYWFLPGDRDGIIGFRLSRGQ
jgi:formylglycine-generating enzyme required for sulfatase activity